MNESLKLKCFELDDIFVKSYEVLNKALSRLVVVNNDEEVVIYGVWLPYDDGSAEKLGYMHSTLSMFEADINSYNDHKIVIMGDFNSDLNRGRRFDKLFGEFLIRSRLLVVSQLFDKNMLPTYIKSFFMIIIIKKLLILKAF